VTAAEIIARLGAVGVKIRTERGVLRAGPSERLTDELRALIRANKVALVEALAEQPEPEHAHVEADRRSEPEARSNRAAECMRCANLLMRVETHEGTRRVFWWRCAKGHALMEGCNFGERVLLAPPECEAFEQWREGKR